MVQELKNPAFQVNSIAASSAGMLSTSLSFEKFRLKMLMSVFVAGAKFTRDEKRSSSV